MTHKLRGEPLNPGDRIWIHTTITSHGHYDEWSPDEIVTVEYTIPSYGKIIVRKGDQTKCLYYDQENYVWDRL